MKLTICFLFTLLLMSSCTNTTVNTDLEMPNENQVTQATKQLRHVVMFKFKTESTPEDIQKVEEAFAALPTQIPEIKDFEWGLNNSPEGLNKDFTHCFLVTFETEEARTVYLPHPAHQAFVEVLSPHLEDVMVMDYWAK
ncbi:MAG: hypothetical protein Sapg2KO_40240 [Saprospiraceae bacterium]